MTHVAYGRSFVRPLCAQLSMGIAQLSIKTAPNRVPHLLTEEIGQTNPYRIVIDSTPLLTPYYSPPYSLLPLPYFSKAKKTMCES